MDAINEAINRGRKISFQMTEYNDRKERVLHNGGEVYVFSPYSLVWDGDCYYVVGWSDKYNGMGSHRVDRIYRRPEILKEDIVPPAPEFDINEYINTMFRMYNAPRKEVLLEVESGLMDAIIDKFGTDVDVLELHEKVLSYDEAVEALRQYIDAKIKGEDVGTNANSDTVDPSETSGCFHVRAKVAVGTVFYNWIFGFGGKVKIVEPEELAERYRELVRDACRGWGHSI